MWFVKESFGICCIIGAYIILFLIIYLGNELLISNGNEYLGSIPEILSRLHVLYEKEDFLEMSNLSLNIILKESESSSSDLIFMLEFGRNLSRWTLTNLLCFNVIMGIVLISHILCVFTNPGTIELGYNQLDLEKLPPKFQSFADQYNTEDDDESLSPECLSRQASRSASLFKKINQANSQERNQEELVIKPIPIESTGSSQIIFRENDEQLIIQHPNITEDMKKEHAKKLQRYALRQKINILYELFARECKLCQCVKPPRAHHCRVCQRCIGRMDHHCPWINNCVGFSTQKPFIQFLVYLVIGCIYSIILFIWKFIEVMNQLRFANTLIYFHSFMYFSGLIFSILFLLFGIIMIMDQLKCIMDNTSYIDRLQHKQHQKRSLCESLEDVFGETFSIWWIIPSFTAKHFSVESEYY